LNFDESPFLFSHISSAIPVPHPFSSGPKFFFLWMVLHQRGNQPLCVNVAKSSLRVWFFSGTGLFGGVRSGPSQFFGLLRWQGDETRVSASGSLCQCSRLVFCFPWATCAGFSRCLKRWPDVCSFFFSGLPALAVFFFSSSENRRASFSACIGTGFFSFPSL